ncbi:MAG: sigma-54-dependent Fis family transcriptional regulator [Rhodospirillales bacterium]|nr:sigma-54-dependent Fis family transcriptional regulator [Rhodospirillales bacterium]
MTKEHDKTILIVDDEADIRSLIKGILEDEGYHILTAANSTDVYQLFAKKTPDLVVLDIWLQNSEHDGIEILKNLRQKHPGLPVIMISGHGTIETAVSSIKQGAYDFIEKPFKSDRLILMIYRALEAAALRRENNSLKQLASQKASTVLTGHSPVIQGTRQLIDKIAQGNSRVLITGEPGTGKETAARAIHKQSGRDSHALVVMNCAIMQPERMECELFGREEAGGEIRSGLLEQADGGSLLFDEIADMPLETQGKIVRVLQDPVFLRVGGTSPVSVDVRFLASTNKNLEDLVEQGLFRKDLYYRLNVVPLYMPRLKDRVQDIPELVLLFVREMAQQSGVKEKKVSVRLLETLQSYEWPGNVRQLRNTVEWMMIMAGPNRGDLCVDLLPPNLGGKMTSPLSGGGYFAEQQMSFDVMSKPLREAREEFERQYLLSQIQKFDGNISKTARFVGMERSALHRKLKLLQVSNTMDANDENSDMAGEDLVGAQQRQVI